METRGAPEGINPACTSPLPTQTLSHVLDEYIGDETVNRPGPQSPSTDAAVSGVLFDWLDASSMKPFFELGVPFTNSFDQTSGQSQTQPQLPFYFGPDILFGQLWDSPPTDGSSHDFTAAAPPVAEDDDSARNSPSEDATVTAAGYIMQPSLSLPHAPGNISKTISQLRTRYDREFCCVMPPTHDFEANPFRFNAETGRGSQLLLHCILALSYKHILRDTGACSNEAKIHKKKALQMLREMDSGSPESDPQSFCLDANFLDAVLILMTLDVTTSAHGPWIWYLKRALKMIQATESLHVQQTPRMQARIEMLVWWDVTLALTSRRGCLVATMTCVTFDMEPVLAVEKGIREWSDPKHYDIHPQHIPRDLLGDDGDPGALEHFKEDLHHCVEAWRYGLLIYIERVFKWKMDGAVSSMLGFLARKTLNHVSSCRRTTMLQKQLLLPVFLAGCETKDEHLRQEARSYYTWWNEKTRYDMFLTATALLEEVWTNQDPHCWWGSVIDQKTQFSTSGRTERQYLFG
ncbi:hypothetical protein QBC33DRAFT_575765 [Phialemonium atrogriseum]|uniref:Transcription factor domain-containing protein n=1 Tax=Phialemonium atrogriseum TaxID=1093897 RepID=A0AAJ0C9L4_9PEZI|nr:uncharacterized protein QBC33DRAFT_575765 [Phialemonium atrogriseum]KAK1772067.1 hypothetical protein QBC33DRAFT_575765 [Phialemonium atrogriseum]